MPDTIVISNATPTVTISAPGPQGPSGGGGGGGISDGDKGDITVSGTGTVWTIDSGVVNLAKLGGDITAAGKALLDDADASAQRTTLGLGTAATSASSAFAASSIQVIAGTGLTGGGDLTANRTLTVAYGTSSTTACVGDDSRLSNARTPTAHTHGYTDVTDFATGMTANINGGLDGPTLALPANRVFASDPTGANQSPDFRALVATDLAASPATTKFLSSDVSGNNLWRTVDATDIVGGVLELSQIPSAVKTSGIVATFDGGGSTIAVGSKCRVLATFSGTITRATVLADQTGSCVVNVSKGLYSAYPTVTGIAASAKPTLSSALKAQDSTLTGWTTTVTKGDVVEFNVESATTVTHLVVTLDITRT